MHSCYGAVVPSFTHTGLFWLVEKQSWDPSLCGGRVVHKHQAVQREWPAHAQVKTMGLDLLKVMLF